jgi:hypothetical protein
LGTARWLFSASPILLAKGAGEPIATMEKKLRTKDEVLSQLMVKNIALKKSWGI